MLLGPVAGEHFNPVAVLAAWSWSDFAGSSRDSGADRKKFGMPPQIIFYRILLCVPTEGRKVRPPGRTAGALMRREHIHDH